MVEVVRLDIVVRTAAANRALVGTQAALKATGAQATATAAQMNASFATSSGAVSRLRGTLATLGGTFAIVGIISTLASFEKAMSAVLAVTGAAPAQFEALSDKAREMGATTVFSATQAAEGMRFLAQAGFEVDEVLAAIGPSLQLAQVGMIGLGESADIVSNVMAGFNIEASRTTEVADIMASIVTRANTNVRQLGEAMKFAAPAAEATGQTIQLTAAAIGVLSDAGLQASLAGTGLRQALLKMTRVGGPAEAALRKMGLTAEDINPEMRTLTDILESLAAGQLGAAESSAIFEARAGTAVLVLSKNIDRLKELEAAALGSGGELETLAAIMSDNLAGAGKAFVSVLQELILQTGDAGLGAAFRQLLDGMTETLRVLAGMSTLTGDAATKFQALAGVVKIFGAVLAGLAIGKVASTLLGLAGGIPRLVVGLRSATIGMTALNFAMRANPLGIVIALIGAAVSAWLLFRDGVEAVDEAQLELQGSTERLIKIQETSKTLTEERKDALDTEVEAINEATGATLQLAIAKEREALATLQQNRASAATTLTELGPEKTLGGGFLGAESIQTNLARTGARNVLSDLGTEQLEAQVRSLQDAEDALEDFEFQVFETKSALEGGLIIDPLIKPEELIDLERAEGVLSDLRFEMEQLGRSAASQEVFDELRAAGVGLDANLGKQIAGAVGRLQLLRNAADAAAETLKELQKAQEDATTEVEKFAPSQDLVNAKIMIYRDALEAGKIDLIEFTELTRGLAEAQASLNPLWVEAQRLITDLKTPQEQLTEATARYQILLDKQLISADQFRQATFNLRKELDLLGPEFEKQTDLADGFAAAFTNSVGAILRGGQDIKSVFADLALAIADLILQILILEPLEEFLRNILGGTGSEREETGVGGGGALEGIVGALAGIGGGGQTGGGAPAINPTVTVGGDSQIGQNPATQGIVDGFAKGGQGFFTGLQTNFQQILGGFGGIFQGLIGAIGGLFGGGGGGGGNDTAGLIVGLIGAFAGGMQHGGTIGRGQFGVVGEAGPEIVTAGTSPLTVSPIRGGGGGDKEFIDAVRSLAESAQQSSGVTVINSLDPEANLAAQQTARGRAVTRNNIEADREIYRQILGN